MKLAQYYLPSKRDEIIMKNLYLVYVRKSTESEDRQIQSIQDQLDILLPLAEQKGLKIFKTFQESKSAKQPGRPEFNAMLDMIQKRKDIKGIICWKANRLTRNPIDEGAIRWLLQNGDIEEIVTPSKTYTDMDSDFTLAVEGAQAQRFISDLRKDTARGVNSKIEKGWAPIFAPMGYKNDLEKRQGEKTISPHPKYFSMMRKLFELALTGNYSVQMLTKKALEMGLKNNRGVAPSDSRIDSALRSPFYTGRFVYAGKIYNGKHKPMITDKEFDIIQSALATFSKPQKPHEESPFSNLIVCGECGRHITWEKRVKKSGWSREYYRCTKWNTVPRCNQRQTPKDEFDAQVIEFLGTIKISNRLIDLFMKKLKETNDKEIMLRKTQLSEATRDYENSQRMLDNLLNMKLSPNNINGELLSDEEYFEKRRTLKLETQKFKDRLDNFDQRVDQWIDEVQTCLNFAKAAQEKWRFGTMEDKRNILNVVGAKLVLRDKKITITAREPFLLVQNAVKNESIVPHELASKHDFNLVLGGSLRALRTIFENPSLEVQYINSILTNFAFA